MNNQTLKSQFNSIAIKLGGWSFPAMLGVSFFLASPTAQADSEIPAELKTPNYRITQLEGIGYDPKLARQDPSNVIKVGDLYYVWYTQREIGTHAYASTIYFATSRDGLKWESRGEALGMGADGAWDSFGVITPYVAVQGNKKNKKYYLYYTGTSVHEGTNKRKTPPQIGVAVASSPDGPWEKFSGNPVLTPGGADSWDSGVVDDAHLIRREGKWWIYYKGRRPEDKAGQTKWGLAIADQPTGPFVKRGDGLVFKSGHTVCVWPHRGGVAALVDHAGPERYTVQWSSNGVDFARAAKLPMVHTGCGPFDPDAFANTTYGGGIKWGVAQFNTNKTLCIVRFDVDLELPPTRTNAQREFKIEKRYLNIPIKQGAPNRRVTIMVDGQADLRHGNGMLKNGMSLADGAPDWWAFMDVSAWRGKSVTLQVDNLPVDSTGLSSLEQSDSIKGAENLYREPLRGQFHFSSRRGWNNDPNGLVFFNGGYHLFYQHNPYGWGWGNMHWGHAVSRDMIHWEELGDVLSPDEMGPMFSGSAVVDWNNTSGLGKDGKPPLILIYTAAGNPTVQCIAYSADGRIFTKFSGNPVLKEITGGNRDPKVMWHEPTKRWVMVLYVGLPGKKHTVHYFTSPNMRDWTLASITEGGIEKDKFLHECPDFFELPVDADLANKKWVLTAADSTYSIGTFDGTKFTPEQTKLPGHLGKGFYAAQTFSDIPAKDGRRIQIGWFQSPTPGMPFNQSMTMPIELKLLTTPDGPRLTMNPVKEMETLRAKTHNLGAMTLKPDSADPLAGIKSELVELRTEFEPGEASEVTFKVRGATIAYDTKKQELVVNDHRAPAPFRNGRQRLTIFCDRTGLEIFASDGLTYVPMPFLPKADDLSVGAHVKGGSARFTSLEVYKLDSIWK
ncbi:MAG: family 43 glycosylhydrolase [Verrucomicrobiota bacterium]